MLVPYGYADVRISTFHAFGDWLLREHALELGPDAGLPGAEPGRAGAVPPDAPVRAAARPLPAARRPDAAPPGADGTLRARQGRGRDARGLPGPRGGARGRGRRPSGRRGAARSRGPHARAGAHLRRVPGPDGARGLRRLRRPDLPRAAPLPGAAVRPRPLPAAIPVHPGRRVPGHELRPVRAGEAPRGPAPERDGGGGRRPGDLPVSRRVHEQHPRVRRGLPRRPAGGAHRELPLGAEPARRGPPADPPQRPGSPRGRARDRQAARRGRGGRIGARAHRLRDHHAGGGRRGGGDRGGREERAAGIPGLRDPRPRQRRRRSVPPGAQPPRAPVDLLGEPGPVRRARRCGSASRSSGPSRARTTP